MAGKFLEGAGLVADEMERSSWPHSRGLPIRWSLGGLSAAVAVSGRAPSRAAYGLHMRFEDLMSAVLNSTVDDWVKLREGPTGLPAGDDGEGHHSRAAWAPDVSVGLAWGCVATAGRGRRVWWGSSFPDDEIIQEYVDILYCGQPIRRVVGMVVDGGRMLLPWPTTVYSDSEEGSVESVSVGDQRLHLFRLLDGLDGSGCSFDEYVARSNLTVTDGW